MEAKTIRKFTPQSISAKARQKLQNMPFNGSKRIITSVCAAFLLLLMYGMPAAAQQSITVSGTVTDASDGQTLPGVNVTVQGMSSRGTSTDADGNYSLTVPSAQDTLVFSFIGYSTQQVGVQGRETIDIALDVSVQQLEDMVVVGYGTQEREQITGSVASVEEEDFVTGNVTNTAELIQGKVAGLQISSAGGDPNSNPEIRLRGISSFSGSQEPLVVIDGIIGASLDNVDPNDVASIDVLKDASASAIYGTRGAAGVIIVTTKTGDLSGDASENFSVNYNGYYTVEGIENKLDVLSASELRELSEQTGFSINDFDGNTNYIDEVTQRGLNNVQSLALSGGSEFTQYRVSGNYRDRQGIQEGTGFNQINGRLNLTQSALDDKLDITFNLSVTNTQNDFGFGEVFRYASTFNPTAPVLSDGYENTGGFTEISAFDLFNPVAIQETAQNEGQRTLFTGATRAEYEFRDAIPGLRASVFYSLESNSYGDQQFYSQNNKWRGSATQSSLGLGQARRFSGGDRNQQFETTLNYVTDIDDLGLDAIIGYSYNDFESQGTEASGGDFVTDATGFNNLSFAQDFSQGQGSVSSYNNTHKIIGAFGRINLNWDDTYNISTSIRREGSTRFGENNKWGTFWSAGANVEITNLIDLPLERLSLRGSYGVTGNDAPFDGISKLRFGPGGNFLVNGSFVQRFGPVSNANPDLKWEVKREFNVGLDFEALSQRLSGSVEYYIKNTDDLIFETQVPVPPNLFPTTFLNIGLLENKGIEATLDVDIIREQDLNWNTGLTFSTFSTELKEYISDDALFLANAGSPGLNSTQLIRVREGDPIGNIWGPEFSRIGDEGQWLFLDAEGNEVTPDQITRDDEKVLGNGLPDYSLGWTNQFNYKNFDFSFFFRGVFGHDMVNTYRLFYQNPSNISNYNVLQSSFDVTNLTSSPNFSSFFVEDASYVRLQNVTIGYTVPLQSSQIRNFRIYVTGNNLFTITDYQGVDPEVNYVDPIGGALAPGIERRNGWFTARSVSLGVKLDF